MERWVGRVALVTGGSSGIGKALAKSLVAHGMNVVACSRKVEKIEVMLSVEKSVLLFLCTIAV